MKNTIATLLSNHLLSPLSARMRRATVSRVFFFLRCSRLESFGFVFVPPDLLVSAFGRFATPNSWHAQACGKACFHLIQMVNNVQYARLCGNMFGRPAAPDALCSYSHVRTAHYIHNFTQWLMGSVSFVSHAPVAGYIRPGGSNSKCVCTGRHNVRAHGWDCFFHGKCLGVRHGFTANMRT